MSVENESTPTDSELLLDAAIGAWRLGSNPKRNRTLQLGSALSELREWLDDDRQCESAGRRHWRGLLQDVQRALSVTAELAQDDSQLEIQHLRAEVIDVIGGLKGSEGGVNRSTRSRLRTILTDAEESASRDDLLESAWGRFLDWAERDQGRAVRAVHVLADLLDSRGQDATAILRDVGSLLEGNRSAVARALGISRSEFDDPSRPEASAALLLKLARGGLNARPRVTSGVVWIRIYEARLRHPPVLRIGANVLLVEASAFENGTAMGYGARDAAPELEDVPPHLSLFLPSSPAPDDDGQKKPEAEVVYARVDLGPTSAKVAVDLARETLEFLVGFASLRVNNRDLWHIGPSYCIVGGGYSISHNSFNQGAARLVRHADNTARELASASSRLGSHLPIRDPLLRTAGRLGTWLRDATALDSPAQLVLCDRVLEQVAGWSGIGDPQELVEGPLQAWWVMDKLIELIDNVYFDLYNASHGEGDDRWKALVEFVTPQQPHASDNSTGMGWDRAKIISSIDELVEAASSHSPAYISARRLQALTENAAATKALVTEITDEFRVSNGQLRRTRNALLHGGPLVATTIAHVAPFTVGLAHTALGTATDLILSGEDLVDGVTRKHSQARRQISDLRSGRAWSEALFEK